MKFKAVLSLQLGDLENVFLNGLHVFAHPLLSQILIPGNDRFHKASVLFIHFKRGIILLHNVGSGSGNDLLCQLRCRDMERSGV